MRGVKKLVNSSDQLCINGIDVVQLVNQLVNNSFELVRCVPKVDRDRGFTPAATKNGYYPATNGVELRETRVGVW